MRRPVEVRKMIVAVIAMSAVTFYFYQKREDARKINIKQVEQTQVKTEQAQELKITEVKAEPIDVVIVSDTNAYSTPNSSNPISLISAGEVLPILGYSKDKMFVKSKMNGISLWFKVRDVRLK